MTVVAQPLHARPQGALVGPDGRVTFRLWAPKVEALELVLLTGRREQALAMQPAGDGYLELELSGVEDGARYAYRPAPGGVLLPDPFSRWQPEGVHKPSAVFFPNRYPWRDGAWRGVSMGELAIYELHVGTFTPEGTFEAIIPRLGELVDLGITAIEIMPVAQFPGTRNWGYDGAHLFAPQNSYGGPRGLQALVDAAHAAGLGVILDVVYNHLGPEGNYLAQFGDYYGDRYHTPWGPAMNYDGPDSDPVRRLVLDNAAMWIRDFHIDGLRLDAVQTIFDFSAYHILAELQAAVQETARALGRTAVVIAETNQNDSRLAAPADQWGYGLDGFWSDDFHHSMHALLTGERDGYYADFGEPADLAKAINDAFVYDGAFSRYHRRRHGNRADRIPRERFVACIQNHDQVGNRPLGNRLGTLVRPEAVRLAAGVLLLGPHTPLLFMGEEYGETNPFPFFCSYGDEHLIEAVREGRRREFAELAFNWTGSIPDAHAETTFASAALSWRWEDAPTRAGLRRLYRLLLHARRNCSALTDRRVAATLRNGDAAGPLLLIERGDVGSLRIVGNLGDREADVPADFVSGRAALLSTAETRFGGPRSTLSDLGRLQPFELALWGDPQWSMFNS